MYFPFLCCLASVCDAWRQGGFTADRWRHIDGQEQAQAWPVTGLRQQRTDLSFLVSHHKLLEAQRLEQRTKYDLEMLRETGTCKGIENYSQHIDGRTDDQRPFNLFDYFPKDYLLVIDESH